MISSDVLIKFIHHLWIADNWYVRKEYVRAEAEETRYYSAEQLRKIEDLIKNDIKAATSSAARDWLRTKLKLREKLKRYLAASYFQISRRKLNHSQQATLQGYLQRLYSENGVDAKQLAGQIGDKEAKKLISSLKVSETRRGREIVVEKIPAIKPLVKRLASVYGGKKRVKSIRKRNIIIKRVRRK